MDTRLTHLTADGTPEDDHPRGNGCSAVLGMIVALVLAAWGLLL